MGCRLLFGIIILFISFYVADGHFTNFILYKSASIEINETDYNVIVVKEIIIGEIKWNWLLLEIPTDETTYTR